MQCKNCGAILPTDMKICPVCEKETTKHPNNRIPRLLIGGAVVLLVVVCVILGIHLQNKPPFSDEETFNIDSFSLIDPDSESEIGGPSSLSVEGAYALTDAYERPVGTFNVSTIPRSDFEQMDDKSRCTLWDNAAESDDLYSTILFEDGTGIMFSKGNSSSAVYGIPDENAYIANVIGLILRDTDQVLSYVEKEPGHSNPLLPAEEQTTVPAIGNVIVTTETQLASSETSSNAENRETGSFFAPAETVYITDSGEKFHRADCSYLNDSAKPLSRQEAEEKGYTACSRCKP